MKIDGNKIKTWRKIFEVIKNGGHKKWRSAL
jgi:hypothetical protein